MLNGIGGRTVAEAKENLSYEEFLSWIDYSNKFGYLNQGRMVSTHLAYVASIFAAGVLHMKSNKKLGIHDFLVWEDKPKKEIEPDNVLNLLKGLSNGIKS